jgi:putative hydrolase of the HAD superfamily
MIKLIIFDLGNVILNFDHMIICRKLSKISKYSASKICEIMFSSDLQRLYDQGKIESYDFFKKVSDKLNIKISFNDFKLIWEDIFSLNQGMSELLLSLKRRYKIFLLSNTNEMHFEYIKNKFKVIEIIDEYILSYKLGITKPDKRIYYEALKKANLSSYESIYIDDIKEYVITANKIGMIGIHFKSIKKLKKELIKHKVIFNEKRRTS